HTQARLAPPRVSRQLRGRLRELRMARSARTVTNWDSHRMTEFPMHLQRRTFLRITASASLGLLAGPLLAACRSAPATPTQTGPRAASIRFGVIGSGLPVTHAGNLLGTFERQGLTVEIVQQRGGAE